MYLNETDTARFYRIWMAILDFTNKRYNAAPNLKTIKEKSSYDPNDLLPVRDVLWKNVGIIDDFILENPVSFKKPDLDILSTWKRRTPGKFFILKHLKNYTVFMGGEGVSKLYAVTGITEPICDMFHSSKLPLFVEAVLLPFEDRIIYDSLLLSYNILIGGNMKRNLNDEYREIKANHGIITRL